jgi:hypothetical protein
MSDDYLWDSSGKPDPDVQRLEELLARYRHTPSAPQFPAAVKPMPRKVRYWVPLLAAAAVVLLAVTWRFAITPEAPAWGVARLEGAPTVGSSSIRGTGSIALGQWLETDAASRARIDVGLIGEVEVEPNTRVGVLAAQAREYRLDLQRGKIHARIWAPPGLFFVNTPSAVAVDLGCRYTLEVDATGAGFLHVTSGWVAFEYQGRESFIPAGAMCQTRPGAGPGTPYRAEASPKLKEALQALDFEAAEPAGRDAPLALVLGESRKEDALTLWHLLSRTAQLSVDERARVYDRMAVLLPPPAGVTREAVLAGDRDSLDLWWGELDVRPSAWWRMWKGSWPQKAQQKK